MNMENELAKEKKQMLRNFMWATIFQLSLLFAALGILFYRLVPNLQISPISPGTEKLLLFFLSILGIAVLLTWIFWYRPALKKYKREYEKELQMFKKSKLGRALKVLPFLMILLGAVIGWCFWYFEDRIFG